MSRLHDSVETQGFWRRLGWQIRTDLEVFSHPD